jgi:hypothetical protein
VAIYLFLSCILALAVYVLLLARRLAASQAILSLHVDNISKGGQGLAHRVDEMHASIKQAFTMLGSSMDLIGSRQQLMAEDHSCLHTALSAGEDAHYRQLASVANGFLRRRDHLHEIAAALAIAARRAHELQLAGPIQFNEVAATARGLADFAEGAIALLEGQISDNPNELDPRDTGPYWHPFNYGDK